MDTLVKDLLVHLYSDWADANGESIDALAAAVMERVDHYRPLVAAHRESFSGVEGAFPLGARDAIVIAYGDHIRGEDGSPLSYLYRFLDEVCEEAVTGVHILPWSPYSSDDGFSVIDYRAIDPALGTWDDVEAIGAEFRLMADLVINHCSAEGAWFQAFRRGEAPYADYFVTADPAADLSMVFRPRTHPLLTPVETATGTRHVWTTFSADQVDLDWANPAVMVEMIDIFLSYLAHGAQLVRLDAIAYLWKEIGHSCLHHPQTHRAVKLLRRVMDLVDPHGIIITETNVPHAENLSYFGGGDEAHMVYNFSLPPLLLDAALREDTGHLQAWADRLEDPGPGMSYFNFCASHDGIGVVPTHGILSEVERQALVDAVIARGGRVSYKATPDGQIPYELNINYLSAVAPAALPDSQRAAMFLATQSVMLSLAGVPGIYLHSLIGSENWEEGVALFGANRSINREKIGWERLTSELADPDSLRAKVFGGYRTLLDARGSVDAFDPKSPQRVVATDQRLFAVVRGPWGEAASAVLAIANISGEVVEFRDRRDRYPFGEDGLLRELVTGDLVYPTNEGALFSIELEPYEVMWLRF